MFCGCNCQCNINRVFKSEWNIVVAQYRLSSTVRLIFFSYFFHVAMSVKFRVPHSETYRPWVHEQNKSSRNFSIFIRIALSVQNFILVLRPQRYCMPSPESIRLCKNLACYSTPYSTSSTWTVIGLPSVLCSIFNLYLFSEVPWPCLHDFVIFVECET